MSDTAASGVAEGLRVAVAGSGPAAFYATDMLLKAGASVDLFERLPAPFGLLRYGVAPDHQNIKRVGVAFERTAAHARFGYFGNVEIGRDLSVGELLEDYDQLLIAVGSARDRALGVPGEELEGSIAATSFVGWYNGHPDFVSGRYDLGCERAVVVGMGNVALDVARILVRRPSELEATDIADYALDALRESRVREVVLLGRRGPAQAAFDQGELEAIADLEGVEVLVDGEPSFAVPEGVPAAARKNAEYLASLPRAPSSTASRLVRLRFLASPHSVHGEGGRVTACEIERTELVTRADGEVSARGTGETERLGAGLVIRSIGYRATPLGGLPFDERRSVIPNQGGRVGTPGEIVPRCYAVGWIKRGPVGLLGTNKQDARETVDAMLADAALSRSGSRPRRAGRAAELLAERGVRAVRYPEWRRIDEAERAEGQKRGKVREKLYSIESMLRALGG